MTTYNIVCLKGGTEVNKEMINLVYRFGFLPIAIFKLILPPALFFVAMYCSWVKSNLIVFIPLIFFIFFTEVGFAVVFNSLDYIHGSQADVMEMMAISVPEQFDRGRFCRLW
jgi:hypothetical protein